MPREDVIDGNELANYLERSTDVPLISSYLVTGETTLDCTCLWDGTWIGHLETSVHTVFRSDDDKVTMPTQGHVLDLGDFLLGIPMMTRFCLGSRNPQISEASNCHT